MIMVVNKPPMGWNSWNTFGNDINEQLILDTADILIQKGLDKLGYQYVVIDDCWALRERDENGLLVADPEKFPHGMKYLADELHKKGLKFGMYSCCGLQTCAGYPSSMDREWIDAKTFAEWGVDYLKYDYCFKPSHRQGQELYRNMGMALSNSGRDILFSACNWGADNSPTWIRTTGSDMWRSTGDINDSWASVKDLLQRQLNILPYGGKGCFNDMDMLIVGMNGKGNVALGGCTDDEYKTHFAAWCMLQSPLMIGGDIRNMDEKYFDLLKNQILIDICQDSKCAQCYRVDLEPNDDKLALARMLDNGDIAIGMFNLKDNDQNINVLLNDIGLGTLCGKTLELTNCWTGEKTIVKNNNIFYGFKPHSSIVFRGRVIDAK